MCYRYAILAWQSGSNKLLPRRLLRSVVEQLLTWLQKCSKILMWLELPNMMFTVLALFSGNCWQDSSHMNMVMRLCSCQQWICDVYSKSKLTLFSYKVIMLTVWIVVILSLTAIFTLSKTWCSEYFYTAICYRLSVSLSVHLSAYHAGGSVKKCWS